VFATVAVPLLFYALGWRFVWDEGGITRTGGLFISSLPSTETKFFFDGIVRKETSILSHSLFLASVSPGIHQVRVERDGYSTWSKTIMVKPELVTELKALLVPHDPSVTALLRNQSLRHIIYDAEQETVHVRDEANQWYRVDPENEIIVPAAAPHLRATPLRLATTSFMGYEEDVSRRRLLWWNDHELWVRWNEEPLPSYQSFPMEQILQTPYEIRNAAFYPRRDAVLVALSNAVMVLELDGRDKRNTAPLYKGKEPHVAVDASDRAAYILDDGTLMRIPLP
jgi:hypothetical protein